MKMLIAGKWIAAEQHKSREIRNPGNGELIDSVPVAGTPEVHRALAAAQTAARRMREMPAYLRSQKLASVADGIDGKREELAVLLARENGKPLRQTRAEIEVTARIFRGFAEEGKRCFGRTIPLDAVPGQERNFAFTIRQPLGVVAAIVPFNYPAELYAHKAAPALAAGNAIIVKPPSECPLTLLRIAGIIEEAGFPPGAHQMITGPGEVVGEALAGSPVVRLISLTGSTPVGARIVALGAEAVRKVHLELGGNDATIVRHDADLDLAATAIVLGRLARGNGQICCAVKRVVADVRVFEELAELLAVKARELKVGDQLDEATDVGPLISERAAMAVEETIQDAVGSGAVLRFGGQREGAFVHPTVLTGVPLRGLLYRNETFGPVVPLVPFRTDEEAVALANDSPYGLQAAVFTRDITRAMDMAFRLEAGGIVINWSSALRVETLPFGGTKLSGYGREGIHDTLMEMTEQKSVVLCNAVSLFETEP